MMSVFADQAVLVDPHSPSPRMESKAAIREALRAATAGMTSLGYTIQTTSSRQTGRVPPWIPRHTMCLAHGMGRHSTVLHHRPQ